MSPTRFSLKRFLRRSVPLGFPPYTAMLELGDGRKVEAEVYAAAIKVGDREGPGLILTFEGAKTVLGVQALEALGLRVNPATEELEATRPKNTAYLYTAQNSV